MERIEIRHAVHAVAAAGSGETKQVFAVSKGERVLWASAQIVRAADATTTSTFDLGDGVATNGYVAALDAETAVGTLVAGAGSLLAASGGKLYNVDDTIDSIYTPGATPGATAPAVQWAIAVAREWP